MCVYKSNDSKNNNNNKTIQNKNIWFGRLVLERDARSQHSFTYCINYSVVVFASTKTPCCWLTYDCIWLLFECVCVRVHSHWVRNGAITTTTIHSYYSLYINKIFSFSQTYRQCCHIWFSVTPRALQHTLQVIKLYTVSVKLVTLLPWKCSCVSAAIVY